MTFFSLSDWPIKRKLMGIIILASSLVVVFATGATIAFSTMTERHKIASDLRTLAEVTGGNCQAALSFDIREDAERMLASLEAQKSIKMAVLYDTHGKVFATYRRTDAPASLAVPPVQTEGMVSRSGRLYVYKPIEMTGTPLGTICLVDDLSGLRSTLFRDIWVMVAFAVFAVLLAYMLAGIFQRIITRDVLSLTETARKVTEKADYSVRAEHRHNDEIGLLTRTFNQMLAGIQAREEALQTEIAEREKAQQELQKLNATLEERVQERTQELQRSNRELEQFAYVASHDLQEPLRSVSNFAGLLKRRYSGKLDSEADEFIEFLTDGATRAQQLINDLLQFSRVGTRGGEFEDVDCNKIMDEVLTNLRMSINEQGVNVRYEQLPTIWGDPSQLRQLLQNLVGNAIKFRREDVPPEICISAVDRGLNWEFAVQDNGVGIDPKYFQQIFVIFKRLESRKCPGTGIGLAVCNKIVERHGGRMWVESAEGQGATFYFTIPKDGNAPPSDSQSEENSEDSF